jgi:acyl-CoA dehydrogenase
MDFELPSELVLLRDTLRRFVDTELIPIEMQAMGGPDLKPEIRARLEAKTRELGLWLLEVPADYGGQELSQLAITIINEELARTVALPARGPGIFGPEVRSILLALNEEQKQKYLHPVLSGEKSTAFAQTEPDAGADPGGMRTTAVRDGDHNVINGYKRFIAHAKAAEPRRRKKVAPCASSPPRARTASRRGRICRLSPNPACRAFPPLRGGACLGRPSFPVRWSIRSGPTSRTH